MSKKKEEFEVSMDKWDHELFKALMKNKEAFMVLLSTGFFELRNGKAIVHKNNIGKVMKVEFKETRYNLSP